MRLSSAIEAFVAQAQLDESYAAALRASDALGGRRDLPKAKYRELHRSARQERPDKTGAAEVALLKLHDPLHPLNAHGRHAKRVGTVLGGVGDRVRTYRISREDAAKRVAGFAAHNSGAEKDAEAAFAASLKSRGPGRKKPVFIARDDAAARKRSLTNPLAAAFGTKRNVRAQ